MNVNDHEGLIVRLSNKDMMLKGDAQRAADLIKKLQAEIAAMMVSIATGESNNA